MPDSKDKLEEQKLKLEIKNLGWPFYHLPSFWISVVTAAVALAGVVGQSYISTIDRAQAQLDKDIAIFTKEKKLREGN
jgi:hypothetical protein